MIVLLAYSREIASSRKIASMCEQNVLFMPMSSSLPADSHPHFTTIANFVSSCPDEIGELFCQVVLICDELGLIGGKMFAIDGCKLPSNASKEWSGRLSGLGEEASEDRPGSATHREETLREYARRRPKALSRTAELCR